MATKAREVNLMLEGQGCLGKAAPDEPVFILRASDILAGPVVLMWAMMAAAFSCPEAKVDEANECAKAMMAWPNRKLPD